jgi:hypothetical protein
VPASLGVASTVVQGALALATVLAVAAAVGLCGLHREALRRVLMGTVDPRPLALFRIGLGLSLLAYAADIAPLSTYLFSDEGLVPAAAVPRVHGGPALYGDGTGPVGTRAWLEYAMSGRISALHIASSPAFVRAYLGAFAVACMGMVLGWHARTCTVVAWLLLVGLLRRGDAHWGGEQTFNGFLVVLMVAPSGAAYSVDAWRRARSLAARGRLDVRDGPGGGAGAPPGPEHPLGLAAIYPRIPAWPQALLLVQLGIAYAANGWVKTGPTWVSGDTLRLALHLDRYARLDWHGLAVALGPWPFRVATWGVLWWERLFPLMLVGLGLRAMTRTGVPSLQGPARTASRTCWLLLAAALAVWAAVPGAMAQEPGPLARERAGLLAVGVAGLVLVVVLGPRLGSPRLRGLRWLVDPRPWLAFGLVFHLTSVVLFGLGAFVSATVCAYVLCGIGPTCVAWVQRLARALARARVPVAVHLRRERPVPPEDPSLPHLYRDAAALPRAAWWAAGAVVLAGAVLALLPPSPSLAWWHGGWLAATVGLVAVGWRAARRARAAPPTAEAQSPTPWAHRPAGRLAAGGLFAYHAIALVAWQIPKWPSIPWRDDARALVSPWMDLTFTKQAWSMFAPNGPVRNWSLRTTIVDAAGVVHDLRSEQQHPENLRRPYLSFEAWRKVDEGLSGNRSKLAPWHARYLCRRWALEHGGEAPVEVVLERVAAPFPPMRPLDPQAWFWENARTTPIVRIACREEPFAQLDPAIRTRHGLPPAEPGSIVTPAPLRPPRPDPLRPLWWGGAVVLAGALAAWARQERRAAR